MKDDRKRPNKKVEYLDGKMQATTKDRAIWIKVIKDGKVTYVEMPERDGQPDT